MISQPRLESIFRSIGSYLWHWNYKLDRPVLFTPDENCVNRADISFDELIELQDIITSQGHPHLKEWTLTYQKSTGCLYWTK